MEGIPIKSPLHTFYQGNLKDLEKYLRTHNMYTTLHKHVTHPLDENIKLINIYINIKYKIKQKNKEYKICS